MEEFIYMLFPSTKEFVFTSFWTLVFGVLVVIFTDKWKEHSSEKSSYERKRKSWESLVLKYVMIDTYIHLPTRFMAQAMFYLLTIGVASYGSYAASDMMKFYDENYLVISWWFNLLLTLYLYFTVIYTTAHLYLLLDSINMSFSTKEKLRKKIEKLESQLDPVYVKSFKDRMGYPC